MIHTFTDIGAKLAGPSGIQELMEDLGQALTSDPQMRMLGGGNPAAVPGMQALWRRRVQELVAEGAALDRALGNYDPPGGNPQFRELFADFLRRNCGWDVAPKNIVVMPGGQSAFFYLYTILAGNSAGKKRRVLFPITPEYIGYANQTLERDCFSAVRPRIDECEGNIFKYRIDFDRLCITDDVAAVCLSCPTNPTGNVISADELGALRRLCAHHGIPLILDQAYGMPFPGAIYVDWQPVWDQDMIVSISLSKLGLPGTRTSVIVAHERITIALANMNAVVALANGNLGQAILKPLLAGDELISLSQNVIRPFYEQKSRTAAAVLHDKLNGRADYGLHASEGAFFLWLWLKNLRITSADLYQRLKRRKVLVVPGHYFFFGLDEPWDHSQQCLRITYSQDDRIVREGLEIIADEVIGLTT
ncbi:MAG: valine--pyruvate transaminase [Verrucomicrobiaceae bacterium]|nr:valine--pyruvate transaminase [Verrucomicrobiaceae bacterium]